VTDIMTHTNSNCLLYLLPSAMKQQDNLGCTMVVRMVVLSNALVNTGKIQHWILFIKGKKRDKISHSEPFLYYS